jgi:AmpD protein
VIRHGRGFFYGPITIHESRFSGVQARRDLLKLRLNDEGLIEGARYVPSPNCDERPVGSAIELIVIHAISLPPGQFGGSAIEALFTNRLDTAAHPYYATVIGLRVSAHFLIRRAGELLQFVPCFRRAWHAGASSWKGRACCNDYSLGIELEGTDDVPFEDAQYARLAELTRTLATCYPITGMVGHSDVAPGRKTDPGPHFDWERYRAMVVDSRQDAKKTKNRKRTAKTPRPPRRRPPKRKGNARKKWAG